MGMFVWARRVLAICLVSVAGLLVPAVAWAQSDSTVLAVADELAKRRYKHVHSGGSGLSGGYWWVGLIILVVIVLIVILLKRKDR
jgi:hypothetical protein